MMSGFTNTEGTVKWFENSKVYGLINGLTVTYFFTTDIKMSKTKGLSLSTAANEWDIYKLKTRNAGRLSHWRSTVGAYDS